MSSPDAHHYWARFRRSGNQRLRYDTRIYLRPCEQPGAGDRALGCIIGKNPGSAGPARGGRSLLPIALAGDKFLPTVLSILRKAYARADRELPAGAFVQVLNLFYLCDRDLATARRTLQRMQRPRSCASERADYDWAWYAWGGADTSLDPLKARFQALSARREFFFDGRQRRVIERQPTIDELAKHTQGLPQADLVRFLAETII